MKFRIKEPLLAFIVTFIYGFAIFLSNSEIRSADMLIIYLITCLDLKINDKKETKWSNQKLKKD